MASSSRLHVSKAWRLAKGETTSRDSKQGKITSVAAEKLNKPEEMISISYIYDEYLTFAGTFEPALQLSVVALDIIKPQENIKYSKSFFDFFGKKLGVKDDRGHLTFFDPGRANWGFGSSTKEALPKEKSFGA
ncbi:Tautomerase/MIF superfamily [Phellopilus nigrolimitatus]|nr:Tautomerase/MIF superfamily [Phellopilus nigrolimitatus]